MTQPRWLMWEPLDASQSEVVRVKVEFIRALGSNDPAVGYNRWPPGAAAPMDHL